MFYYLRLEWLFRDKHSSFLGSFLAYEENEVWPHMLSYRRRLFYLILLFPPRLSTIKHYGLVIYWKLADFVVS